MLSRHLLVPVALCALAGPCFGQEFASSTPATVNPDGSTTDRVVVTAFGIPIYGAEDAVSGTKTDTALLDIPQTVNVVTRQVLDDEAVLTLPEALNNVGGVNTGGTYRDYDIYSIRGFFGTGFTYLDGLLVDREGAFQEEPFGLERIEVIQGPASVLYGQNPPGGLVNLISKTPQKTDFTNTTAGGGSFGLAEFGVDSNAVLNQSGSVYGRLNFFYRQYGTFTKGVDPSERLYFAPALTIELTKKTRLTLLGQYYHTWNNIGFPLPAYGTVLPNPNGDLSIRRNVGEPGTYQSASDSWRVLLGYQLEHHFNDVFTLRQNARAGFHESDFQGLYPSFISEDLRTLYRYPYENHENYTTLGLDTLLLAVFDTGPDIKHTALVGVDYYYQYDIVKGAFGTATPLDLYQPVYGIHPGGITPFSNTITDASQTGIYFQEQVKLFDRVSIVGGGREDFVSNDLTDRRAKTENNASPTAFSPRAGIVYEILPRQVSAYFSYSESFQSNPGYLNAAGSQIEPEAGEQYEIGVKADLFNGKLSSTVALYQIDRSNVPTADPLTPNVYVVTGEERHRGVDFNTAASPIKGWDIIAAYGYIDARVTRDNTLPIGARPLDVPEHTFNLFTKYTLQDGPLRGLGFGVGFHYQTKMEGDAANTFQLPSYGTLNLAAYYQRGRFSAQFNVLNVTDERYATGAYNTLYVQEGDPISVRGSVGWHF